LMISKPLIVLGDPLVRLSHWNPSVAKPIRARPVNARAFETYSMEGGRVLPAEPEIRATD